MAKIIKKRKDRVFKKPGKSDLVLLLVLFAVAAADFAAFFVYVKYSFLALGICAFAVLLIFVLLLKNENAGLSESDKIKRFGNEGEYLAGEVFKSSLSDDFTVIRNAVIRFGGKRSEIDNIIIGPSGIFVIEVKNMKGAVSGDYDGKYWEKDKTDKNGAHHKKSFYSPVKQVGTHIYRLANYLRQRGINVTIRGAVYFDNTQTSLSLSGAEGKIPVFSRASTYVLIKYINEGKANLPPETVEKIVNLIN